jgi:DNA end-binding protein Ku
MAKAAWKGYIALGQLGIPVRLHAATQLLSPHFVQLHDADGSPVERVLRCKAEHRDIAPSEVVRAIEHSPGRYITLTDHELERAAANPVKTIAIRQFSDLDAIEPIYFEKPYYVVPGHGGERAYSLLREVFARKHKLAVAQFVIYNKEHIAALSVHGDLLVLYQLRFAAEIVSRASIKTPPLPKPTPAEIDSLSALVERLSGPLYIQDYHDEHAEQVSELIERKAKGLPAPRRERFSPHATPEAEIVDVLQAELKTPTGITGSK